MIRSVVGDEVTRQLPRILACRQMSLGQDNQRESQDHPIHPLVRHVVCTSYPRGEAGIFVHVSSLLSVSADLVYPRYHSYGVSYVDWFASSPCDRRIAPLELEKLGGYALQIGTLGMLAGRDKRTGIKHADTVGKDIMTTSRAIANFVLKAALNRNWLLVI